MKSNKLFRLRELFRAVNQLNGVEVEGRQLKVELASDKRQRRGPRGPGGAPFGGIPGQSRQTDFPLRILVQSDMVSVCYYLLLLPHLTSKSCITIDFNFCVPCNGGFSIDAGEHVNISGHWWYFVILGVIITE